MFVSLNNEMKRNNKQQPLPIPLQKEGKVNG